MKLIITKEDALKVATKLISLAPYVLALEGVVFEISKSDECVNIIESSDFDSIVFEDHYFNEQFAAKCFSQKLYKYRKAFNQLCRTERNYNEEGTM